MVKGSSHSLKDLAKIFSYKLSSIRNWLGPGYWLLQNIIFSVFILKSFSRFFLNLSGGATTYEELQKLLGAFTWWLAIFAFTTVVWVLGRQIFNLDLYIYY